MILAYVTSLTFTAHQKQSEYYVISANYGMPIR